MLTAFLLRVVVNALALWVAASLGLGVSFERLELGPVLGSALVLAIVNAIVRPVMVLLTLPLTLLTMGLFLLVVNGLSLAVVAALSPLQVHGFGGAVLGALALTVLNWLLYRIIGPVRR